MKKVFFSCSIAGGREHAHVYEDIVGYIKGAGGHVLSEIFADKTLTVEHGTKHKIDAHKNGSAGIREWDLKWIAESEAMIAEVTQPSLGVGYEVAKTEEQNKPILALFCKDSGRRLSPMISGSPHVQIFEYTNVEETKLVITKFIKDL